MRTERTTSGDKGIAGRARHERGFTLIETMCAIGILCVSLLGLASVAAYAINNNSGGRSRELGLAIAQQRLEKIRNTDFSSLTAGTVTENNVTSDGMGFMVQTKTCASAACNAQSSATQKVITIKVTPIGTASQWAGTDSSDSKAVVVTTYRAAKSLGPN